MAISSFGPLLIDWLLYRLLAKYPLRQLSHRNWSTETVFYDVSDNREKKDVAYIFDLLKYRIFFETNLGLTLLDWLRFIDRLNRCRRRIRRCDRCWFYSLLKNCEDLGLGLTPSQPRMLQVQHHHTQGSKMWNLKSFRYWHEDGFALKCTILKRGLETFRLPAFVGTF